MVSQWRGEDGAIGEEVPGANIQGPTLEATINVLKKWTICSKDD